MQASRYQAAILDFVRNGSGHGLVEATAGSGKTTTLALVADMLVGELGVPPSQVAFLAFNRSAAEELRDRLPGGVVAQTLHALGRRVLADAATPVQLDEAKYLRLAADRGAPRHAHAALATAARLARLELVARSDAVPEDDLRSLVDSHRLELPWPRAAALLGEVLELGLTWPTVDFTDLLYLPVRLELPVPRFRFVCVDEAQDMSRLSLAFVQRLTAAGARALFVGDAAQAIYAFAGADPASLARVSGTTAATRLPLSVSYRCPSRHVVLARRFSPHMLPAPRAPVGRLVVTDMARLTSSLAPGDLVLSRTNGPLLDVALTVARAGLSVAVLGDELLTAATDLVAALGASTGRVERRDVERSLAEETTRLEREMPLRLELAGELEAAGHRHKAAAVAIAAAPSGAVPDVAAQVQRLFGGARPDGHVLLSTIHKAKGREASRVLLLGPEDLGFGGDESPSPRDPIATQAEDDMAEANVLFVALTRAKSELVLVEKEPGALRRRLSRHAVDGAPGWLAGRWDDVLRLALTMSKGRGRADLSSRHGEAWRVQDARRQAGGSGRGRGGRTPDRGHHHR